MILLPDGRWILPVEYKQQDDDFAKLVKYEIFDNWQASGNSACVELMHRFKLAEYEPLSDAGHLIYLPRGAMIKDLVSIYAKQLALSMEAIPVHSSVLYDRQDPAIAEHLELFGERSYQLDMGNRSFVMRHAACYGQFAMLKGQILSYRDLPLALYELADCYRYELSGAISGLARQRSFSMPDIHVFCRRDPQFGDVGRKFSELFDKIFDIAQQHDLQYYSIYNIRSDFLDQHGDLVKALVAKEGKSAIIRRIPQDKGFYWVLNIEFCIIDASGRPVEIATIQIDVDNAQRFDIKYIDEDGDQKYPVIIHAALLGSIERFLDALLEQAAIQADKCNRPLLLPLWVAPIQFRLIPIADNHMKWVRLIHQQLEQKGYRGDIDDRPMSLSRKIVDAEAEAIEIVCVIGDGEVQSQLLSIRDRRLGKESQMSINHLYKIMAHRAGNFPSINNPLPINLRSRPSIF